MSKFSALKPLLTSTAILVLAATVQAAPSQMPATAAVLSQPVAVKYRGPEASAALAKVFADSDEANLHLSPISAMVRGDNRFNDQFGDYITDPYIAATEAQNEIDWRRLHEVDRASLTPEEQVAYDVFEYQTRIAIEGNTPALIAAQVTRPLDHMNGLHVQYADISSGNSFAPYKTVKDYDDGLKRIDGFILYLDRCIDRMREGMRTGVVQPKLVVRNMIVQLDDMLKQGIEKSPFYNPIVKMPANFSTADKTRLTAAYRSAIGKIDAEYAKLRKFLNDEYLPASRDSVGISAMPGGPQLYAYLVENQTTTKMKPEEIHQLGLSEVARITAEMEKIRKQVGYSGGLHAFFDYLRSDPKFAPKSAEDLHQRYVAIKAKVEAAIPRDFSLMPKAPLEIRPVPSYLEKSQTGAYYNPGTPDGSRPGVFYYNTYDLPSRQTWENETLFLHEGEPGHHFQISLTQENPRLPKFLKFGGNTAYVEGWALYSESLGTELGMFTDPYQMFGHLNDEMLRAMRLVVDTGIHAKGWTRDQAIQYMLDHSAMSKVDATQEVERYIANPAQALAYKVGQLTIRRLRTKAEAALGSHFDVRAFHAQVLDTGALPMEVLEAKIDRWIAAQKAARPAIH
jgi:uncharacterized protein (DUF885 family)